MSQPMASGFAAKPVCRLKCSKKHHECHFTPLQNLCFGASMASKIRDDARGFGKES
jgi:hypothetical protein